MGIEIRRFPDGKEQVNFRLPSGNVIFMFDARHADDFEESFRDTYIFDTNRREAQAATALAQRMADRLEYERVKFPGLVVEVMEIKFSHDRAWSILEVRKTPPDVDRARTSVQEYWSGRGLLEHSVAVVAVVPKPTTIGD